MGSLVVGGDILLETGEEGWDEKLLEGRPGGGQRPDCEKRLKIIIKKKRRK